MVWFAEIWKWTEANLVNWFVVLWWFTAVVFLLSAYARWFIWRWLWRPGLEEEGWWRLLLLAVSASWWGDWKRLARRFAIAGDEVRFVSVVLVAQLLPVYALLIIFALGKEYLLVYLIAVAVFVPSVVAGGKVVLSFSGGSERSAPTSDRGPFWMAPVRELFGVLPRFALGIVLAAILAAVAIHPRWTFPVEITGAGLVSQLLNALFGVVLAVGAWTPPVGAFLFSVPVWRGGLALAGLYAFLLAIPAAPQAVMTYAEWLGRAEAAKLAAVVLVGAVFAGMVAALMVAAVGLPLPYVYSPDQLLH